MSADVFFIRAKADDSPKAWDKKVKQLWDAAGFAKLFHAGDLAAVKMHFGERGNVTYVRPHMIKPVVDSIRATKAKPFLTDTATLYRGSRSNAVDHTALAMEHGFTVEATGAPVVMADGLFGNAELEVDVQGKRYKKVRLAADIVRANAMMVLSHATGHCLGGFGAAIKNLGMGCASRKGKLSQHSSVKPSVNKEKCVACGICVEWCPTGAAQLKKGAKSAEIVEEICIGCGECLSMCPHAAITFNWGVSGEDMQERMAEHALGVHSQKAGKIGYITYVVAVTKECDCWDTAQTPLFDDIGALASYDPVAIDAAALGLIESSTGKPINQHAFAELDHTVSIRHGESIGLGTTKYKLRELK